MHRTLANPPAIRIFAVPNLSVEGATANADQRDAVDGREQVLIHFLSRTVLLNSQPGGYYRGYVPEQGDVQSLQNTGPINRAFQYLFTTPAQTFRFANEARDNAREQLRETYLDGYRTRLPQEDGQSAALIQLPHIDLFPSTSLHIDRFDGISPCFCGFFPISRWQKLTFSLLADSFSLGLNEYMPKIATHEIIDYDHLYDAATQAGAQYKAILIPHLDPGFVSYGAAEPLILRLMLLSWFRTVIFVDVILEMITEEDMHLVPGTAEFCNEVIQRINAVKGQVQNLTTTRQIERTRGQLIRAELQGLPPPGPRSVSASTHASDIMAQKQTRYGLAADRPNSRERQDQRHRLLYPESPRV
ncbi:hypothetical protein BJV82DRAFT_603920 [Fennellomyces sp. T-0311]|nr:hypothetical protein BJV82DRAFT_603920 [Fennellomyces sp. T-0311]